MSDGASDGASDARPLAGKRVLVTRPGAQGIHTAARLRERGAAPWVMPTIALAPPADPAVLDGALSRLSSYDWLVFTSENGVARSFAALAATGAEVSARGAAKIAAIGRGTARALEALGLQVDLVASDARAEGLADAMLRVIVPGARVLILRAAEGREVLPDLLRRAGFEVDDVAAYRTVSSPIDALREIEEALEAGELDAAIFTSASTLRSLCAALGARAIVLLARVKVVSIGPITTQAATALGVRVDVEASEPEEGEIVRALEASYAGD